ncbi:MAG: AbrB/MazE/SpoVT family DNA-binding domain-containing protein [Pseudomonadota bacterium]
MESIITITMDAAGRVVIPAAVRRELALAGGAELRVEVEHGAIHLCPVGGAVLARRGRRLVARVDLVGEVPDHRELREKRNVGIER